MISKKKIVYTWCCDFENYRGEGRLSRFFVNYLKKRQIKCIIKTPIFFDNSYKKYAASSQKKKINLNFFYKYITPIIGLVWLWKNFFLSRKILYLNFNPLWNIFIFIFSPPGTNFGPITGSLYTGKINNFNQFFRYYFFPILFKISIFFLNLRKKNFLFSTSLLKNTIPKKMLKKCIFDFQILYFDYINNHKNIKNKKNIDLIYYNRKHEQKQSSTILNILDLLSNYNQYKKIVIGNDLHLKNFLNLKTVEHKKLLFLLSKSRYTFFSPENYLSIFLLEAVSRNVKIFIDNKCKSILNYFENSNFIFLDFLNKKKLLQKIIFHLNANFKIKKTKLKKSILNNINNKINYYLDEF